LSLSSLLRPLFAVLEPVQTPVTSSYNRSFFFQQNTVVLLVLVTFLLALIAMSWSSRFGSWGGRFSPFGRGGQSAEVTDKDFEYITSADLASHAASNARASSQQSPSEHDILILKHRKVSYPIHFPAYSIERDQLTIGELRIQAAKKMAVTDPRRIKLFYRGRNLKDDTRTAGEEGLRSNAEILCVVGEPVPTTLLQEDGDSEDEDEMIDEGATEAKPKRKRNRKTGNKRKGKKSGTASASDATPSDSTASLPPQSKPPPAPLTPLQKLDAIASFLHTNLVPQCVQFISSPPSDPTKRDYEHKRLGETILAQVLLKLDAIETDGQEDARARRKELVKEANAMLAKLDEAVKS